MFLAFGNTYRNIAFKYTDSEIRSGVETFFKKEQMLILQNYETLANIVGMALGGKKKGVPTADNVVNVQSADQMERMIRSQLNGT